MRPPTEGWYLQTAHDAYQDPGSIEIDQDATISVGDGGAWVSAWVWISGPAPEVLPEALPDPLAYEGEEHA